MRKSWFAAFLLVFAVVLLVVRWRGEGAARETQTAVPSRGSQGDAIEQPELVDSIHGERREYREAARLRGAEVPGDALVHLSGTVTVFAGEVPTQPDVGRLIWLVVTPEGKETDMDSAIEAGRWSMDAPPHSVLRPEGLTTRTGRRATARPISLTAEEANGREILADWNGGITLSVMDAESREHVKSIELFCGSTIQNCPTTTRIPPLALQQGRPCAEGNSPIALPSIVGIDVAWVHAPGWAWGKLTFSGETGNRTVLLKKGGALECEIASSAPGSQDIPPWTVMRLYEDGQQSKPIGEWDIATEQTILCDGVVPGRYNATLERKSLATIGSRLCQASGVVRVGKTTHVTLDLGRPSQELGAMRVLLRGSRELLQQMSSMLIRPEGQKDDLALQVPKDKFVASDGGLEWKCSSVLPGKYVIELQPFLHAASVEVVAGVQAEATLDVPSLSNVFVTLLDVRDGHQVQDGRVLLRPIDSQSNRSWQVLRFDYQSGAFHGTCSPGRVQLSVTSPGLVGRRDVVDVAVTPTSLVYELEREVRGSIVARFWEGGAELPLEPEQWKAIRVRPMAGGDGEVVEIKSAPQVGGRTSFATSCVTLVVNRPGLYEVVIPPIPFHRCLEQPIAEVAAGSGVPLDIHFDVTDR